MKIQRFFFTITLFACLSLFACNRKDDVCTAGIGGNLTLAIYLQHHGKTIPSLSGYPDTVFIKFNSQDKPADDVYDKYIVGQPGQDHIQLTGMKCGSYYLFAAGYDTSIKQRVVGAIPFTTDKTTDELNVVIPVTEGD